MLDTSSEILFNYHHLISSPTISPELKAPGASFSLEDPEPVLNGSPELPTVLDASPLAVDAAAVPHGPSQSRAPATPHSILQIWLDPNPEDLASARPGPDPSIAMALPSHLIPDLLQYVARLSNPTRANTLTLNVTSIGISPQVPSSNKRKLHEDTETSQADQCVRVEIAQAPKRQKRKGMFSRMPLQDLDTSSQTPTEPVTTPPNPYGSAMTLTRNSLYSKDGSLQLGIVATSQPIPVPGGETVEVESTEGDVEQRDGNGILQPAEEISSTPQTLAENQPTEATPRLGRWGFGDLLKSARSVSKFLPGFTPRLPPAATPVIEINTTNSSLHPNAIPSAVFHPSNNVGGPTESGTAQSLQPESSQPNEPQIMAETQNPNEYHMKRQKNPSKKRFHSKREIQPSQKRAERRRVQLEAHNAQAPKNSTNAETDATTPGTKRKRMSSPDNIPNPTGSTYGMDLDYFGCSSSDDEEEMITPTKARSSKHRRVHGPDSHATMVRADTGKAQPYTGGFFSSETVSYEGGNIFSEVSAIEMAQLQAKKSMNEKSVMPAEQSLPPRTPITNLTGSFRVPSPSDSDSDPEDSPGESVEQPASPTELAVKSRGVSHSAGLLPRKSSPRANGSSPQTSSSTNKEKTSLQSPPGKVTTAPSNTVPTTWTQPPPPRPIPSHAALPSVSTGDSEALARARKKALQHLPHKPSGLRASSRMSSPRILEDSDHAIEEGNAASIPQAHLNRDNDTALTMRSENAGASKHGQSNTLAGTESVENLFENEVHEVTTKEGTTDLTTAEPVLPAYVRDPKIEACLDAFWTDQDTKRASDMFEGLYAAFLVKH